MAYNSKATLNKVMLIGRLGKDPEIKYTSSEVAVVTLNMATNTSYKSQDGEIVEKTEWHRVVIWRKTAEMISQYAKKGDLVYIEGKLATRSWDDKDGNKQYMTEIQAEQVQILQFSQTYEQEQQTNFPDEPADDLPF